MFYSKEDNVQSQHSLSSRKNEWNTSGHCEACHVQFVQTTVSTFFFFFFTYGADKTPEWLLTEIHDIHSMLASAK